jgi:hypothetical protein
VSICNAKPRRGKDITNAKIPVARSYTLPFSKYGSARSCKQFSARNTIFCDNHTRSSLEARVALGILNTDLGDVRQYLARFWNLLYIFSSVVYFIFVVQIKYSCIFVKRSSFCHAF